MPDHERGEFWPPEKSAPSLDLRARAATQATIAVAIMLLAVWVARDFLVALTCAAVIAITCWPIYLCFERLVGHHSRSLAAPLFKLVTAARLLGDRGAHLVGKIADATRATVNGTIAAAIAKGAVIGIAYILTGVPHPVLFTFLTMALAMVPLGAWLALGVAALTLALQDGTLLVPAALFVFGAGTLLIGDNFVQPALIGGSAELPFLLVLIGILCGLQSFGLVGLFLGPVIMAAF